MVSLLKKLGNRSYTLSTITFWVWLFYLNDSVEVHIPWFGRRQLVAEETVIGECNAAAAAAPRGSGGKDSIFLPPANPKQTNGSS